ncbi:coiled-coil domain-containing protein 50 isoform X2 [Hyla sarda]|uniref:coiled-coil domain-containing protein 50 isoform X2 n=1 Tax=Hyla sarda TaxID=327740 RepID=UPI0024C41288|nr:coiled-coil domain-containing protein 50 isoform X2 [Hyla sarda]
MTEVTIDKSKLPGVKEVCRDFAVLEDHSLAHSLQEQEIEHHLATNVKRNRLVKHDLQVAKQLQEEEDIRAQARIKHRQEELELLDGEIAQEIQEKLVIEAELKRMQEEKDEDIARVLQEKEKRRKKHYPPRSPEEPCYPDNEGHHRGRRKDYISEYDRPHRHERPERNRRERGAPKSEQSSYYDDDRKRGRSAEPRSIPRDNSDLQKDEYPISKTSTKRDRPERPPPPRKSKYEDHDNDNENADEMNPIENMPRRVRSQSHDLSTKHSGIREHQDSSYSRAHKRGTEGDHKYERHRRRTPSPQDERQYRESGHRESPQAKVGPGVKNRDVRDADIARRLQEEEIRVHTEDYKAAQLAQDEELARWLMEKEQQSYKKSKAREREKTSDRKRPDDRELNSYDHGRPRSREEQHRSRSDKPYRPLPPAPDEDHSDDHGHDYINRNSQSSPRSGSKSQSSHKGSYKP